MDAGTPTRLTIRAAAALALGASLTAALLLGFALLSPAPASATDSAASIRPHIVKKYIPFGDTRKAQMADYEAFRAMYEGRNAKMFHPTTAVITSSLR